MKRITVENAEKLIGQTQGTIFAVTFKKKDGTLRDINCRLGVHKGVKGIGMVYDPREHDLLTVYDLKKAAYRVINRNTLRSIRAQGKTFKIVL